MLGAGEILLVVTGEGLNWPGYIPAAEQTCKDAKSSIFL